MAYPTDTSYGLAVDVRNIKAIKRLYRVKERLSRQPVHVIAPSVNYARKIVQWNKIAHKLSSRFFPGPLTLVLKLKAKGEKFKILSGGTGFLGIRVPKNKIALDLVKYLKAPITTPSANPPNSKGGYDSYSVADIVKQFANKNCQPDIIINAGKLPKRKPSTMVKIHNGQISILRRGPISETQIKNFIS